MAKRARTPISRRDTLKGLGIATAGLAVGCKKDGEPDGPELEGFDLIRSKIDTVVVLMMENRSFDHYLGALSLEEGRTDVDGLTSDIVNPHPDGRDIAPFRARIDCLSDPPHGWGSSHDQFNGGLNDQFVVEFYDRDPAPDIAEEAMGYFNREDLPALYALSDAFVTCDMWFSSLMTSTQPNRVYLHCGQNGVIPDNSPAVGQDFPSIYKTVEAAGHTWGCYYANAPGVVFCPDVLIGQPQLKFIDQFFLDAAAGTLPNVVLVEPAYGRADDHPPAHPTAGQIYIAQIYEALANSPQWERTLFIVTYDEHGGFHDHVAPPTAPDDAADEGFDQLGFRVPTVVIGPWVKPGHVSHVVYDHTSATAFIEQLFEVGPLTTRTAAADPMLDCLDLEAMKRDMPLKPVVLDPIEADPAELYSAECVTDGSDLRWTTGQPELEAYIRENFPGPHVDRIDQTDAIFADLLDRAEKQGVFVPKKS